MEMKIRRGKKKVSQTERSPDSGVHKSLKGQWGLVVEILEKEEGKTRAPNAVERVFRGYDNVKER